MRGVSFEQTWILFAPKCFVQSMIGPGEIDF